MSAGGERVGMNISTSAAVSAGSLNGLELLFTVSGRSYSLPVADASETLRNFNTGIELEWRSIRGLSVVSGNVSMQLCEIPTSSTGATPIPFVPGE